MNSIGRGMSEPPEGAIVGENVPTGSEPDASKRAAIEGTMGKLKARGEPYTEMSDDELEEMAVKILRNHGVNL